MTFMCRRVPDPRDIGDILRGAPNVEESAVEKGAQEMQTDTEQRQELVAEHDAPIVNVLFSPDGRNVASASTDGVVSSLAFHGCHAWSVQSACLQCMAYCDENVHSGQAHWVYLSQPRIWRTDFVLRSLEATLSDHLRCILQTHHSPMMYHSCHNIACLVYQIAKYSCHTSSLLQSRRIVLMEHFLSHKVRRSEFPRPPSSMAGKIGLQSCFAERQWAV